MVEIFAEKAQIDSAVESAAKSARLTGFKLSDIRDLEKKFNFDMDSEDENFISVFCDVFAATLNLKFLYVIDNKAYFKSIMKDIMILWLNSNMTKIIPTDVTLLSRRIII